MQHRVVPAPLCVFILLHSAQHQAQKKPVTQERGLAPSMATGRPANWEPRIGSMSRNIPGLGLSEDSVGSYFEQDILPDVVRERRRLQMVPDFKGFTFRCKEQM